MTFETLNRRPIVTFLVALLFLNILWLNIVGQFFAEHHYLPSPFINDKSNTFMDFYNTLWWSEREPYSDWKSVYPPLNFLLAKSIMLLFPGGSECTPECLRDIGKLFYVIYVAVFVLLLCLIFMAKIWRQEKFLVVALGFASTITSLPFLFLLERGNFLIFSLPLFSWLLSRPRRLYIPLSLLVNLKPYFIIFFVSCAVGRYWRQLFLTIIASSIIFLAGMVVYGLSSLEVFSHIFLHANSPLYSRPEILSFPTSIGAFEYAFESTILVKYLGLNVSSLLYIALYIGKYILLAYVVIVVYASVRSNLITQEIDNNNLLLFLLIALLTISHNIGGYGLVLVVVALPLFFSTSNYNNFDGLLLLLYISPLLDSIGIITFPVGVSFSYLGNEYQEVNWSGTLGTIFRPVIGSILTIRLSCRLIKC